MKIERTKNATRNITYGLVLRVYQMIVLFFMRTAMIYLMGVQYLGLDSLFVSILQVLNLAELGVGSAMVYSMYKPIAQGDEVTICALMKLYRIYYRVIGSLIAIIGCAVTPFIPRLISGDVPSDVNVYVLYLLNLSATVLSYWLFMYKSSILQAHQRTDIINKVLLITTTVKYGLQLLVLYLFKNYYYYVIVVLLTQVLTNIITAVVASKLYPQYKPSGEISKDYIRQINQRMRDLFTAKIGAIVVNSADTIVISAFLGLTLLAVYQNYYIILTTVIGIISIIFTSCTAGIGNSLITETAEKNFDDLKKFTFLIIWIATFCSCSLLNLYQPFIKVWVGEELMLGYPAVICFVIYYFIYEVNQLLNTYKDAAGVWHEDRFRPLVTAIVNVVLNLTTVNFLGIYGVLLSTAISMLLVGMPWILRNLFTTIFSRRWVGEYLKSLVIYTVVAALICVVTTLLCSLIHTYVWLTLLIRLSICIILPNFMMLVIYRKSPQFKQVVVLADHVMGGRLQLTKLFRIGK